MHSNWFTNSFKLAIETLSTSVDYIRFIINYFWIFSNKYLRDNKWKMQNKWNVRKTWNVHKRFKKPIHTCGCEPGRRRGTSGCSTPNFHPAPRLLSDISVHYSYRLLFLFLPSNLLAWSAQRLRWSARRWACQRCQPALTWSASTTCLHDQHSAYWHDQPSARWHDQSSNCWHDQFEAYPKHVWIDIGVYSIW